MIKYFLIFLSLCPMYIFASFNAALDYSTAKQALEGYTDVPILDLTGDWIRTYNEVIAFSCYERGEGKDWLVIGDKSLLSLNVNNNEYAYVESNYGRSSAIQINSKTNLEYTIKNNTFTLAGFSSADSVIRLAVTYTKWANSKNCSYIEVYEKF